MAKTLYEKLFDAHVVFEAPNETPLLYIDRHLVHEVTSPQTMVMPGRVTPCSGPITWTMP